MQSTLQTPNRTSHLEASAENWGTMCWLMEDRLVPEAGVSVARMSIYAGCVSPTHRHPNCNETIALLSGQATSIVDGEEYVLKAGDVVFVPRGAAHTIRNDGSQIAIAMLSYSAGVRIYEAIDSESI